ncbi:MAG: tripartite tricarboxylate transporter TctB family protein [Methyloligellaceae bacterium]
MTRRMAELLTALTLLLLSIYFMYESAKLPIGWVKGHGPGGGMFPFYMSALILVGSIITLIRVLLSGGINGEMQPTPELDEAGEHEAHAGQNSPFINPEVVGLLAAVTALLFGAVAITQFLGMYVGVPLMMFFYLAFIGKHSWFLTILITVLTPVIMFFFFELSLKIILPKGATETFFQYIYALVG